MKNFFGIEGPVMSFLGKLADLIILNIIYIICCLPIVTIGAATTGLYYVTLKMSKDEEGYILKDFFRSFKQNFRQATVIWLILLTTGTITAIEFLLVTRNTSGFSILLVFVCFQIMVWSFVALYVFAVLSRFENTILTTIKNSFLLSLANIPKTFILLVFSSVPVLLVLLNLKWFPLLLFVGFSAVCYSNCFWLDKIFKKIEPEEESDSEYEELSQLEIVEEEENSDE